MEERSVKFGNGKVDLLNLDNELYTCVAAVNCFRALGKVVGGKFEHFDLSLIFKTLGLREHESQRRLRD